VPKNGIIVKASKRMWDPELGYNAELSQALGEPVVLHANCTFYTITLLEDLQDYTSHESIHFKRSAGHFLFGAVIQMEGESHRGGGTESSKRKRKDIEGREESWKREGRVMIEEGERVAHVHKARGLCMGLQILSDLKPKKNFLFLVLLLGPIDHEQV